MTGKEIYGTTVKVTGFERRTWEPSGFRAELRPMFDGTVSSYSGYSQAEAVRSLACRLELLAEELRAYASELEAEEGG